MGEGLKQQPDNPRRFIGEPSEGFDRHYIEVPAPTLDNASMPGIDPGIRMYVDVLSWHGVETNQSCEGSEGHAYPEPTVDFTGTMAQVWRACHVALEWGLPVSEVGIRWHVDRGMPQHPIGFITFTKKADANYTATWRRAPTGEETP